MMIYTHLNHAVKAIDKITTKYAELYGGEPTSYLKVAVGVALEAEESAIDALSHSMFETDVEAFNYYVDTHLIEREALAEPLEANDYYPTTEAA